MRLPNSSWMMTHAYVAAEGVRGRRIGARMDPTTTSPSPPIPLCNRCPGTDVPSATILITPTNLTTTTSMNTSPRSQTSKKPKLRTVGTLSFGCQRCRKPVKQDGPPVSFLPPREDGQVRIRSALSKGAACCSYPVLWRALCRTKVTAVWVLFTVGLKRRILT